MGKFHELERTHVWGGVFGIDKDFKTARENFRPAVWRPITAKALGALSVGGKEVNLTGTYVGVHKNSAGADRRKWGIAGIVMPEPTEWHEIMRRNPEGRVMLIATTGKGPLSKLGEFMIGDLASRKDVGHAVFGNNLQVPAHAFRMGPEDVRFGMAVEGADGRLLSPHAYQYLDDILPTDLTAPLPDRKAYLSEIGRPGGSLQHVNIS